MKKLFSIFTAILIATLFTACFASTTDYHIEPLRLTVSLPEGFYVFTKGMAPNDPLLGEFGLTPAEVDEALDQDYLQALREDGLAVIGIIAVEAQTGETPFENQTDEQLLAEMAETDALMASYGVTPGDRGVLRTGNAVFTWEEMFYGTSYDSGAVVQYMTLSDGLYIMIQARTYALFCDEELLKTMHEIVSSVRFEDAGIAIYSDPNTGLRYVEPAGFREAADVPLAGALSEKAYVTTDSAGNKSIIQYYAIDLYGQFPDDVKAQYGNDRARLSSHDWSLAEFKLMVGSVPNEFTEVYYGGNKFFRYANVDNGKISPQFFAIDNGYLYMFQYSFTEEHELFGVFADMLASVEY